MIISQILSTQKQKEVLGWSGLATKQEIAQLLLEDAQDTMGKLSSTISKVSVDISTNVNNSLEEMAITGKNKLKRARSKGMTSIESKIGAGSLLLDELVDETGDPTGELVVTLKSSSGAILETASIFEESVDNGLSTVDMTKQFIFSNGSIALSEVLVSMDYPDSAECYHLVKNHADELKVDFSSLLDEFTAIMDDGSVVTRLVERGSDYTLGIYYSLGGSSIQELKTAGLDVKQCVKSTLSSSYGHGFNRSFEDLSLTNLKTGAKLSMKSMYAKLQDMYSSQDITSKVMAAVSAGNDTASDLLASVSGYASKYSGSAKNVYDSVCSAAHSGSDAVLGYFTSTYQAILSLAVRHDDETTVTWDSFDGKTVDQNVGTVIIGVATSAATAVGTILMVAGGVIAKAVGGLLSLAGAAVNVITKALSAVSGVAPSFHYGQEDDIFGSCIAEYESIVIPVRYRSSLPGDGTLERFRLIGDAFVAYFYHSEEDVSEKWTYSVKVFPNVHAIADKKKSVIIEQKAKRILWNFDFTYTSGGREYPIHYKNELIATCHPVIGVNCGYAPITSTGRTGVKDFSYHDILRTEFETTPSTNPAEARSWIRFTPYDGLTADGHLLTFKRDVYEVSPVYNPGDLLLVQNDSEPKKSRKLFAGKFTDDCYLNPVDCSLIMKSDTSILNDSFSYYPMSYGKYALFETNSQSALSYPQIASSIVSSCWNLINYYCSRVSEAQDALQSISQAFSSPMNRVSIRVPFFDDISLVSGSNDHIVGRTDPLGVFFLYGAYGDFLSAESTNVPMFVSNFDHVVDWGSLVNNFLYRFKSDFGSNKSWLRVRSKVLYPNLDEDTYEVYDLENEVDVLSAILDMVLVNKTSSTNCVGILNGFTMPSESTCAILPPEVTFSAFILGMSVTAVTALAVVVGSVVASGIIKKAVQRTVVKRAAATGDLYSQYEDAMGYGDDPKNETLPAAEQNKLLKTYVKSARKLNFFMNFTGIGSYDACSQFAAGDGYSPMVSSVSESMSQLYGFCEEKITNANGEQVDEPIVMSDESQYPVTDNSSLLSMNDIIHLISGKAGL